MSGRHGLEKGVFYKDEKSDSGVDGTAAADGNTAGDSNTTSSVQSVCNLPNSVLGERSENQHPF